MNEHHTKYKGDLGLSKIISDLVSKGYFVSIPISENSPFDLVITSDNGSYTVQCKYREIHRGSVTVKLGSSWADRKGNHYSGYLDNDFDILAIYINDLDKCIYMMYDELRDKRTITIRVFESRNKQKKNIYNYSDYLALVV